MQSATKQTQSETKPEVVKPKYYSFPALGISILAVSYEDALEKLKLLSDKKNKTKLK